MGHPTKPVQNSALALESTPLLHSKNPSVKINENQEHTGVNQSQHNVVTAHPAPDSRQQSQHSPNGPPAENANGDGPPPIPKPTWLDMLRFIRPFLLPADLKHGLLIAAATVAIVLGKITGLLPPLAIKSVIDTITANESIPTGKAKAPIIAVLAYFGLQILNRLIGIVENFTHQQVSLDAERRFSVACFEHLHSLGLDYHLERKAGEVVHMMDRASGTVGTLLDTFAFNLMPTLFETILVTSIFWKLGVPWIALSVIVSVVLYIAFTISVTRFRMRVRRRVIEADDAIESKAVETLINYETVATFGRTRDEVKDYETLRRTYQDQSIYVSATMSLLSFVQSSIQLLGLCVGLCVASYSTVYGSPRLSAGSFVVIQLYINQLFRPLMYLGYTYRAVVNALTDLEKAMSVLRREPQITDSPDALPWIPVLAVDGTTRPVLIEFNHVSFHYSTGPQVARGGGGGVSDITFCVAPGKVMALVGRSGSGKSTLMRLALRLYDAHEGTVILDGHDIRTLTQESLRRNVGIVAQDTVLFNNTLRYNIAYGKPDATDAEIWKAARAAALGEMIEKLPDKLDAIVGERGLKLSGGERQRVGIARCILKNPPILLLDEATSALDSQTEKEIQANLEEVSRSRTTIMIAHRLSTIVGADEIIVIDDGVITQRGTHLELVSQDGTYATMWKQQTTAQSGSSGMWSARI